MAQRRKRRPKAEIEAEKAAKAALAAEEPKKTVDEVKVDEVFTEMVEEAAPTAEVVEEAPAKRVKPADHKPKPKPKAPEAPESPLGWAARFRARRDARGK